MKNLVILISGSGSNLQTFIDHCQQGLLDANIACVISNKADAYGLTRAKQAGIKTKVLDHKQFASREAFDEALADIIEPYQPDLVILAGFMRILTPAFVTRFMGKMLNIHPSLLPKYPGLNTHQRAIDAGDKQAGVTVHFVTPELDGGPAILQAAVNIEANETADTLSKKVLQQEHRIYPLAAQWFLQGRVKLHENICYFENQALPETGKSYAGEQPAANT